MNFSWLWVFSYFGLLLHLYIPITCFLHLLPLSSFYVFRAPNDLPFLENKRRLAPITEDKNISTDFPPPRVGAEDCLNNRPPHKLKALTAQRLTRGDNPLKQAITLLLTTFKLSAQRLPHDWLSSALYDAQFHHLTQP